jgi:hypothetical protein
MPWSEGENINLGTSRHPSSSAGQTQRDPLHIADSCRLERWFSNQIAKTRRPYGMMGQHPSIDLSNRKPGAKTIRIYLRQRGPEASWTRRCETPRPTSRTGIPRIRYSTIRGPTGLIRTELLYDRIRYGFLHSSVRTVPIRTFNNRCGEP